MRLANIPRSLSRGLLRLLLAPLRPSARTFWCEALTRPHGSFIEALHGYIYLRWPLFYIGMGTGRHPLSRWLAGPLARLGGLLGVWGTREEFGPEFAQSYHGKVMPPGTVPRLIAVERPVATTVPETVLPFRMARDIILDNADALALLDCPCRLTKEDHCTPVDVCILAGGPVVDFVLEHHPDKARRVTPDEAIHVVEAENRRGHVSHAFFKEAVLGRYYAICNCCTCCCGAMQAHREGTPMLVSSGYVARVDADACTGCGQCARICPFDAVRMAARTTQGCAPPDGGSGNASPPRPLQAVRRDAGQDAASGARPAARHAAIPVIPIIDAAVCMGCGVCELRCPGKALRLELAPGKPAPLVLPGEAVPVSLHHPDLAGQNPPGTGGGQGMGQNGHGANRNAPGGASAAG
ncbi:ATP-binding protein [Nitratidesulfovibrio termitidis]|uniref:ATP-binding protein n=1 Tax=Nitratidesulfovibrio termitidis TaxID=42252 RepID=UPI0004229B4F|nr:4Fe-4S binding protein [Nitratidesulfovibrio termitidis]